jgi:hypothetical protein
MKVYEGISAQAVLIENNNQRYIFADKKGSYLKRLMNPLKKLRANESINFNSVANEEGVVSKPCVNNKLLLQNS